MVERLNETYKLFSEPSFFEGLGRLFDWGSTLNNYNISESEEESDYKALASDWANIGEDMRMAVSKYEQQLKKA